jgi:hypothetical protein
LIGKIMKQFTLKGSQEALAKDLKDRELALRISIIELSAHQNRCDQNFWEVIDSELGVVGQYQRRRLVPQTDGSYIAMYLDAGDADPSSPIPPDPVQPVAPVTPSVDPEPPATPTSDLTPASGVATVAVTPSAPDFILVPSHPSIKVSVLTASDTPSTSGTSTG